jgi:N6-adenosine-specific RNA methylase IME4
MKLLKKRYDIIYADPPWRYDFSKDSADKIENHYPTMSIDELKALEVPANDNCILFMWTTAPKIKEAIELMEAWGFEYKTHCIWHKMWIGMGYWFRGNHELLFVGTKGRMSPPDFEHRINSVYSERKTKHSKKPYYFRKIISDAYPELSKLEMFSRKENEFFDNSEGWDMWGNETECDIELSCT